MSNTWGSHLHLSIFGESHGNGIGMVLDGIEPGTRLDLEKLAAQMKRRAPGGALATARKEADEIEWVSGIRDGKTIASPIMGLIRNTNQRSSDYQSVLDWPRPSHADYTAYIKYNGHSDLSGGGHFSGRLTAPLVAAGEICRQAMEQHFSVSVGSHLLQLAEYHEASWNIPQASILDQCRQAEIPCDDPDRVRELILKAKEEGDSVGGIVETAICGIPAGLGDPFFDSLESRIAHLLFSVPAVKGVGFGAAGDFASMKGSEANDAFALEHGRIVTTTNHNGGIEGGISNGMPIVFRSVIKPTASILRPQTSLNLKTMESEARTIQGRHDPCIVLRAIPVLEAVSMIALYDALLADPFVFARLNDKKEE